MKHEVQHKQRQAARLLKAKAEEEAIKVSPVSHMLCPPPAPGQQNETPAVIEYDLLCTLVWPAVQRRSTPVSHWCVMASLLGDAAGFSTCST